MPKMTFLTCVRILSRDGCIKTWIKPIQRSLSFFSSKSVANRRNHHSFNQRHDFEVTKATSFLVLKMRHTQASTHINKTCNFHCIAKTQQGPQSLLLGICKGITISERGKKTTRKQIQQDEDESDSDDSDDEMNFKQFDEDEDFPSNYRELKAHMQTIRLDAVVSSGLNISRNQVEKYFLSNALRINGARAEKKHTRMDVGDYVDLITEKSEEGTKVKRVRVIGIDDAKSKSGKLTVYLRAWRANVFVGEIYQRSSQRE